MAEIGKFDLNIERVLEHWGVDCGIREVIANALDEQALTGSKDIEIFKDKTGRWHVRDFGRGLKYEHLTQNENSEKQARSDLVIGKFGVGLKDALATFDRHTVAVLIKSRHSDITIAKSVKHGFTDITTLHALISTSSEPAMIGTDFILHGANDADVIAAKDFFLRFSGDTPIESTAYGTVLDKNRRGKSRIYIKGLRVAEEENFLFSYNITKITSSIRKALNRERTNVGRTAYVGRIKDILLGCKTEVVAQRLVDDLQQYERGTTHEELSWIDVQVHACKLLNVSRRVIFLTPQELAIATDMTERARSDGYAIVTVPEALKWRIQQEKDNLGNPIRDLGIYTKEWNDSFTFEFVKESDLSAGERAVFNKTAAIYKLIAGRPKNIKQILISKTMRTESFRYHEAVGLWEPDLQRIIIKREQLRNLEMFAGTLLHETAHAISGARDVTQQFEEALSELLGKVAKKGLQMRSSIPTEG